MAHFNLIDEPWIPCLVGGIQREMSLRETLQRAKDIDEIIDVSPLTTIAMHRLLLAILHREFGPKNTAQWDEMWRNGWYRETLDRYLEHCHDGFDLFHPERPFYQNGTIIHKDLSGIQRLTHELGPANSVHFSHVAGDASMALTPGQAARYLLAYQLFSPGGLVSLQSDEPAKTHKSARAAPLANSAVCLVRGANLAQTLLLNMVRYDPATEEPFYCIADDLPAWERAEPAAVVERRPDGYLDWLTWQSRRVRLFPTEDGGRLAVDRVLIMKGNQLPPGDLEHKYEQMVAYRFNPKATKTQNPWPPVGFQRDRAVWRDSLTFFGPRVEQEHRGDQPRGQRPGTLGALANRRLIEGQMPLDMFGVATDQFNALFWRHERLPLDPTYLREKELRTRLDAALGIAEGSAQALNGATRRLAELLLSPLADEGGRQPDGDAARALVSSLAPSRRYWARLEAPFGRFLHDQSRERTVDAWNNEIYGTEALRAWANQVRAAAQKSYEEVTDDAGASGWTLKAAEAGRARLASGLARVRRDWAIDAKEEAA